MGNRSYLYIQSADGKSHEQVAEANNNFPTLWKLLLAEGSSTAAITDQRVFGDAETDNLTADAPRALQRLRDLAAFVREHPQLDDLPQVELQFDALNTHFSQLVDQWSSDAGPARFSANLDELSWLDDTGSPSTFIETCRQECATLWARIGDAIETSHHPQLDDALGLAQYGSAGFADWEAWAWNFGFGGVNHAYFEDAEAPREESFDEFAPPENENRRRHLGNGWRAVEENGRWGFVHEGDDSTPDIVLPPEWDTIANAGSYCLLWGKRGEHFGLLRLDESRAEVLLAPGTAQLEEVWGFEDGIAIVQRAGKQGFLREDGSWLMEPMADELWQLENGYASFRIGEHQGVVDAQGCVCIEAQFEDVYSFSSSGLAVAESAGRSGLLRADGSWVLPPEYKSIEFEDSLDGYVLRQAGLTGLCAPDGSPRLAVQWDEILPLLPQRLLAVRRKSRWGVCDWQGRQRIEPRFHSVEFRYEWDLPATEEGAQQLDGMVIELIVRVGKLCGVVTADGAELVPPKYLEVQSFEALPSQVGLRADPLFAVARRALSGRHAWGVFDAQLGRETLDCCWSHLERVSLDEQEFVFFAHREVAPAHEARLGTHSVAVLRADGAVLHPPEYAWLAAEYNHSPCAIRAETLRKHWQEGEPVQALHAESKRYVWLYRDGRVEEHVAHLTRRFENGDPRAALTLGRHLRDSEGADRDPALARIWLARAAGGVLVEAQANAPAAPEGALQWLRKRLTGGTPQPAEPKGFAFQPGPTQGDRAAMLELAEMLIGGVGGPVQAQEGHAWLEHSLRNGGADHRDTLFRLAFALDPGPGSEEKPVRALELYKQAAALGHGVAWHNLGLHHQFDTEADTTRALECYREADRLGLTDSAYRAGRLLREEAQALQGKARRKRLGEAAYYLRKACDDLKLDEHAEACCELALVHLDPQSPEHDPARAEVLLLPRAKKGHLLSMEALAQVLYGPPESKLHNAEKATRWAELASQARASE